MQQMNFRYKIPPDISLKAVKVRHFQFFPGFRQVDKKKIQGLSSPLRNRYLYTMSYCI